jgi:hypothetical protein
VTRTERCACGSEITVWFQDPIEIVNAVRAHNNTDRHIAWRLAGGLSQRRDDPELFGRIAA